MHQQTHPRLPSSFAHLLAHADLPPPGPDRFAARRALWTTPTAASRLGQAPSTSRVRLEYLLDEPGALERPDIWDAGLKKVWKGLIEGGRLKKFLPLRVVVKILYAGWRRDGTWPDNAMVVDEDNFFGTAEPQSNGDPFVDNLTPFAMSDTSSSLGRNPQC
ncbi:hypothetical protein BJV74DRAFT_762551 [Russula compacta]|nr:hypothetical protein BJV74DRAFT_762551 [Russula compacta]